MPLAKVWAKPRRGQNPKWPPAAILDLLKSAILRRFYSNNTIEVSFLTNSEVRNPFQGLFFQILAIFTLKSKMAAGGHFGFWPLLGLAHTFARGIGAQFFLNTSKYPNPLSNLPLLSVVTGGPNMTLLQGIHNYFFTSFFLEYQIRDCLKFVTAYMKIEP